MNPHDEDAMSVSSEEEEEDPTETTGSAGHAGATSSAHIWIGNISPMTPDSALVSLLGVDGVVDLQRSTCRV
jgi:hypothetical protein